MMHSSLFESRPERFSLAWIADVLRSPMHYMLKDRIMYHLASGCEKFRRSTRYSEIQADETQSSTKTHLDSPDDRWVLVGLCESCPFSDIKQFIEGMTASYDIKDKQRKFAKRKRGRYSVHFVPRSECDSRRGVPPIDARVEKVDVKQHYQAGTLTAQGIFKLVVAGFSPTCHFVAVFGLDSLSDDLLKWFAEDTHNSPWRTIFLIDCDASFK